MSYFINVHKIFVYKIVKKLSLAEQLTDLSIVLFSHPQNTSVYYQHFGSWVQ